LHLSRDATLLAFAWLGISLIFRPLKLNYSKFPIFFFGITIVILGLSFRPWLALAFAPLTLAVIYRYCRIEKVFKRSFIITISISLLATCPLILDISSKNILSLRNSYPEQQVMMLDIASLACLSSDQYIHRESINALEPISKFPNLNRERLCGSYYPQSWGPLVFYSDNAPLRLIAVEDQKTYQSIRNSWLELIINYPQQYVQIKISQLSQLFLAGDSTKLVIEKFNQALLIPYELVKALRLFSFLPIFLLFSWMTFSSRVQISRAFRLAIYLSYLLTIGLVTVAFAGDNQRYISWAAILFLFTYLISPKSENVSERH
jgi:hypothetical protein